MASRDVASRGYYAGTTAVLATRGHIQSIGTVIRSMIVAYEAIRATPLVQVDPSTRARDIASAGVYGGVSTIIATAGYRVPQFSLVVDYPLDLSAVKDLALDYELLIEILANSGLLTRAMTACFDAGNVLVRSTASSFDGLQSPQTDIQSGFEVVAAIARDAAAAYDGNRLILIPCVIPLETAGAWGVTVFLHAAGAVHFMTAPLRSSDSGLSLMQPSARDTASTPYVYTKSTIKRWQHNLMFRASKAVLDSLLYFHASAVQGEKQAFTWYDQDNQQHAVRFADKSIPWKRIGPDRYEISVHLCEDSAL